MKTIVLYGELARRFGKYHRFSVRNVAEAVRALRVNFKGFEEYLSNADRVDNTRFKVFVGGSSIAATELQNPTGGSEIIRIVPIIVGAKSDWLKIITGVVLIAAAVVGTALGIPVLPSILGSLGASMVIGGVAGLLTSPPPGPKDTKPSHIFSGPENVTGQGLPVPVGYGRMIVGSIVISAGVETYEERDA